MLSSETWYLTVDGRSSPQNGLPFSGHSRFHPVSMDLLKLSLLLILLPWVQAARLWDGRVHGNVIPKAIVPRVHLEPGIPVISKNGTQLPPYNTTYYFDQLIDHNNPSLGTFKQRYWHTYEFYEPGGPVVLNTPGEENAFGYVGYLTNRTVSGQIAQQQNGAAIVLEHRFYGLSNPYPDLKDSSLSVHTIQQAIDDLVYFARNVKMPMPNGDQLGHDKAPWVLVGGSYSGALTAWTMVNKPGVFAAGYASSAVVQAITEFWQYFDPARQFMPKNCSADVQAVIEHVDFTFSFGSDEEIDALKNNFGLGAVKHLDDAAGALRNNFWEWQSLSPNTGPNSSFYQFCDALEVKDGVSAGPNGWGLDHALNAWGTYWNTTYYERLCGNLDAESCFGTYNSSQWFWTDPAIDNSGRSWMWTVCSEVGFFQGGAPSYWPTIVTRLIGVEYDIRQCSYYFPERFKTPAPPDVSGTNEAYHGWSLEVDHLFFANGQRDPWRDATVSSDFFQRESTDLMQIGVSDAFHCSDLLTIAGTVDKTVLAVQQQGLAAIRTWLEDWKPANNSELVRRDDGTDNSGRFVKPINVWTRKLDPIV